MAGSLSPVEILGEPHVFHRLRSRVATEMRIKEVRLSQRQFAEFVQGFDDGLRAGYFGTQLFRPSGDIYVKAWLLAEQYVREDCLA